MGKGLNLNNIRQLPARQAGGPDEQRTSCKQNAEGFKMKYMILILPIAALCSSASILYDKYT